MQDAPATSSRRIVVLNNGTPPMAVDRAVERACKEVGTRGWSLSMVHREPPLDPVLSWYGGIAENCREGDVVFLHGDDDLMLPGSISLRTEALTTGGGSFLISRAHGGLYFDGVAAEQAYLTEMPSAPVPPARWRHIEARELVDFGAAFIGNHCYRFDQTFRAAVERALAWMRTIPLHGTQQLAMLPYFLPIAVADLGRLLATDGVFVIRGQSTQDLSRRRFGHSTWRPGVLYAASLHILQLGPLADRADLAPLRAELQQLAATWHLPTLTARSSRLEWNMLRGADLLRTGPAPRWRSRMAGLFMVARAFTGTQALRFRLWQWRRAGLARRQLLDQLWSSAARHDDHPS